MRRTIPRIILTLLLVSMLTLFSGIENIKVYANDTVLPVLTIEPKSYTASYTGQVFDVDIKINDLSADWRMVGVAFILGYNVAILEVLGVAQDPSWQQFICCPDGNVTFDYVTEPFFLVVLLLEFSSCPCIRDYPEGNLTVCTITFNATSELPAHCALQLEWSRLGGEYVLEIPHLVEHGYYKFAPILGDTNFDGKVDLEDFYLATMTFGSCRGYPEWSPLADVNDDGKVDLKDVYLVAINYGKTYP